MYSFSPSPCHNGKKILKGDPVLGAVPWLTEKSPIDFSELGTDLFAFLHQQYYLRLNFTTESTSMAQEEHTNYLFFLQVRKRKKKLDPLNLRP